jgi:DNA-binding response OmpR family regulator
MKRPRALVADDNVDLRDVVSYILQRFEVDVVTIGGGELHANMRCRTVEDAAFDVIFADAAMPWSSVHAVRRAGLLCPVVVMTALRVTHEQVAAFGPAIYVLRKPFSIRQLEAVLVVSLDLEPIVVGSVVWIPASDDASTSVVVPSGLARWASRL